MSPQPRIQPGWPQGRASCQCDPPFAVQQSPKSKADLLSRLRWESLFNNPPNLDLCHYSRPVVFQPHLLKSSTSLKWSVCKIHTQQRLHWWMLRQTQRPTSQTPSSPWPAQRPMDMMGVLFLLTVYTQNIPDAQQRLSYLLPSSSCFHHFTLITVQKQQLSHPNHAAGLSASMPFIERREPTQTITWIFNWKYISITILNAYMLQLHKRYIFIHKRH